MKKLVLIICSVVQFVVMVFAYDMVPLPFKYMKAFNNGKTDQDLLIAKDPAQAGGQPVGPHKLLLSDDGKTVFIWDDWQRKRKFFDSTLDFRFAFDFYDNLKIDPELIEGSTLYGLGYSKRNIVIFSVVDIVKKISLAEFDTGISFDELGVRVKKMYRNGDNIDLMLYSQTDRFVIRYNVARNEFKKAIPSKYTEEEYQLEASGVVDWKYLALPTNDYAMANKLTIVGTRDYFGEYKGYRVWIGSMRNIDNPLETDSLFGRRDPETLFVLIGKADDRGTPIKGFYLPPIKYYRSFKPLLAFSNDGNTYLMYVDDASKRAQVIRFDLDNLVSVLPAEKLP